MKLIRPVTIVDAMLGAATNIPEPDGANDLGAAAWASGTTYSTLGEYVFRPNHKIYKNINDASNVGKTPEENSLFWLDVGYTNRWRMLSHPLSAQSVKSGDLVVEISPGSVVDAFAMLNVEADTFGGVMESPDEVDPVWEYAAVTGNMISTAGITDAYRWHFEPIRRKREIAHFGLPPYLESTLTLTLSSTGTAKCGLCVVGQSIDLGATREPARFTTTDYSQWDNVLGEDEVSEGPYARRASYQLWLPVADIDWVRETLEAVRATPCVYVGLPEAAGSQTVGSSINFGFYEDFDIERRRGTHALVNISIRGTI